MLKIVREKAFFKKTIIFMSLKSISPFLASILLIGFTIASGIIIYYFSITLPKYQTAQISNQSSKVISCAGAGLEFKVTKCNLDKNLVLWLPLDDVNSTNYTLDFSGYGNDGKLFNYPCNPATCNLTSGVLGKAISFDGVDDYVGVPYSESLISPSSTNRLTWSAWFKGLGSWSSSHEIFFAQSGTDYISVYNGALYVSFNFNNIQTTFLSDFRPQIGRFYHVAMTWDGTYVRIYVNGSLVYTSYSQAGKQLTWNTGYFFRAGVPFPGYPFEGLIDEVRIYNRALTDDEIKQLYYNELNNKFNISLQLIYPLGSIANSIGKDFTAIVFLKNETIIQKDFSLDKELGLQNPIVDYNLTIDEYYPNYGFVDKIKICSKACSLICNEIKV
jgi:hypothetical protein